ncbi:phosphonate C-P lyase system protein PhnH [Vreelandella profundi]|uniref:phosphonate C-P lyase system protein PhnH n=1 Tax=Vreelandella profundi TaxID=2852117 RepID=UPI001EF0A8DC|nr:phosphonate C-P lyase system protein PhnH [Halomonas profundi]
MHDSSTGAVSHNQQSTVPRPHDWPALDDAVHHGQRLFRQLLSAMAEPGTIAEVGLAPLPSGVALSRAAWGAMLALCDLDTRVWIAPELNRDGLAEAIGFHTGACIVTQADQADFALLTPQSCQKLPGFAEGSDSYPDRSTTLVVVLEALSSTDYQGIHHNIHHDINNAGRWRLSGPGILETKVLTLDACAEALMMRLSANRKSFPCGSDAILTCAGRLIAIPRSTRIAHISAIASTPTATQEST